MRVVSGLLFFPRGGSAHVARNLARELPAHGIEVTLVSGSLSPHGDARRFYAGLDVRPVDFAAGDAPMHPSYEDRRDAPDTVFARIDDAAYEEHVEAWARALDAAGAAQADVLHLHHLTPMFEAAARVAPGVPVVAHLHGTELLMLERIAAGGHGWPHAEAWAARLRAWAHGSARLLVLARAQVPRVVELLGTDPGRCVLLPNGFDPVAFRPAPIDRGAHWRATIGTAPAGPVAVTVSRFTAVKRLPLLIRAWARAEKPPGAALAVVGGFPGEVEDEHPADVIAETGSADVHLAGWHEHDALPAFFRAADLTALASVREQFGAVLVEGMACGLPAVAVDRFGPAEIVEDGRTGWLVPPDDEAAMAGALSRALGDEEERRRRGAAAREVAVARYAWPALAGRLAEVLRETATGASGGAPVASPRGEGA